MNQDIKALATKTLLRATEFYTQQYELGDEKTLPMTLFFVFTDSEGVPHECILPAPILQVINTLLHENEDAGKFLIRKTIEGALHGTFSSPFTGEKTPATAVFTLTEGWVLTQNKDTPLDTEMLSGKHAVRDHPESTEAIILLTYTHAGHAVLSQGIKAGALIGEPAWIEGDEGHVSGALVPEQETLQ